MIIYIHFRLTRQDLSHGVLFLLSIVNVKLASRAAEVFTTILLFFSQGASPNHLGTSTSLKKLVKTVEKLAECFTKKIFIISVSMKAL